MLNYVFFKFFVCIFVACCFLKTFFLSRFCDMISLSHSGGGRTTLDFPVINWLGVSGSNASGDVKVLIVKIGRLITTASTSVSRVWRDSTYSWLLHRSSGTESMLRAVQICRSQTPSMWLAQGTFSWSSIQSQLRSKGSCRSGPLRTASSATRSWHPQGYFLGRT